MTEPTGVNTNTQIQAVLYTLIHTCIHTHTLPQKLIIKWFWFLDLISPPICQVQSSSFILIQTGNLACFQCRYTFSCQNTHIQTYTRLLPAKHEAPPPLVCRNKQRPFVVVKGRASKQRLCFFFINRLQLANPDWRFPSPWCPAKWLPSSEVEGNDTFGTLGP